MSSPTTRQTAMLETLEVAYDLSAPEDRWSAELLERAEPWLAQNFWAFIATYRQSASGVPRVKCFGDTGAPYDVRSAVDGGTAELDDPARDAIYGGFAAHTLSQLWAAHPAVRDVFDAHTPPPTHDLLQITCRSGAGQGVLFGAGLLEPTQFSNAQLMRFSRVAAHVSAAHRLRTLLEEPGSADLPEHERAEALIGPDGNVVHAEGDAKTPLAREQLRDAALVLDRARSRRGRTDPGQTLKAWKALVAGRWTIVDHFDTDQRRYLVAMVNPPELRLPLALEPDEARVAEYAAQGYSQKYIAYELGLDEAEVSRQLKSALAHLGLSRRADLVALVRGLHSANPPES